MSEKQSKYDNSGINKLREEFQKAGYKQPSKSERIELNNRYMSLFILVPFGYILFVGLVYNLVIGELPVTFGWLAFTILDFIGTVFLTYSNISEIRRIKH